MNDKFDELAKGLAQSVTRRGALKKFGVGLAGIALATLGLANKAQAGRSCGPYRPCPRGQVCSGAVCVKYSGPPGVLETQKSERDNYELLRSQRDLPTKPS